MFIVQRSERFDRWLRGLRDHRARLRIAARLRIVAQGSLGDWKSVGEGVAELRVDCGPGYRLYFTRRGEQVLFLLVGGDKRSQAAGIRRAQAMARELDEDA